jgi:maltose O-acetyltransferase
MSVNIAASVMYTNLFKKVIYGSVEYFGKILGWSYGNLLPRGQIEYATFVFRRGVWRGRALMIGSDVIIRGNVTIQHPENVVLGSNCQLGDYCHIWGGGGVSIGSDTLVAAHTVITSQTHNTQAKLYRTSLINKPVHIGSNVWIGAGVIVLPGVSIGSGSIIGAGSLVNIDIPERVIAVGVPVRVVRSLDNSFVVAHTPNTNELNNVVKV